MQSRKGLLAVFVSLLFVPAFVAAEEGGDAAPATDAAASDSLSSDTSIFLGAGAGAIFYEGDEPLENGLLVEAKLDYDFDPRWTGEFNLGIMPDLGTDGGPHDADIESKTDSVFGVKTGVDVLYHFNDDQTASWDPFSALGGGLYIYDEDVSGNAVQVYGDLGAGLAYHFNNRITLRGDYRLLVAGEDSQFNHTVLGSIGYQWGARGSSGGEGLTDEGSGLNEEGPLKNVYFDFDKSAIKATEEQKLKENVQWLKENAGEAVTVEGHCDERGTNEYNMALGDRRATSVSKYYKQAGVDAKRVGTVSFGEERPADPGHNEASWSKNRRAVSRVKK